LLQEPAVMLIHPSCTLELEQASRLRPPSPPQRQGARCRGASCGAGAPPPSFLLGSPTRAPTVPTRPASTPKVELLTFPAWQVASRTFFGSVDRLFLDANRLRAPTCCGGPEAFSGPEGPASGAATGTRAGGSAFWRSRPRNSPFSRTETSDARSCAPRCAAPATLPCGGARRSAPSCIKQLD